VSSLIDGIPIVYEDDDLIIVNKPAGMLSQPGRTEPDSVVTRVLAACSDISGPSLVHRLDMDTSGLLMLAKTPESHRSMQQQFEHRKIAKRYRAALEVAPDGLGGLIQLPLRLDIDNRPQQIVCREFGKHAITVWHKDANTADNYVVLFPITGRSHQLRVHLADPAGLNNPIKGDRLYGNRKEDDISGRMMLHSDYLSFNQVGSSMKSFFIAYGAAIAAFIVIDGLWLAIIAKNFYTNHLGDLLRTDFLIVPGVLFYLAFTAGLVYLAVRPWQPELPLLQIAINGAIVGFLAYGTYDLTNLSTLKNWPVIVSIVDLAWGTVLSASVAVCSAIVVRFVTA